MVESKDLRAPRVPVATFEHAMQLHPRAAAAVLASALLVAACGSSSVSNNPNTLLKQTFSGQHKITSGTLSFQLTITPSGSSTLHGPITLNFGGPFESRGQGKLPKSNFSISLSANGRQAAMGIISTGTTGYVTLDGQNYLLPQATFQKLESNFASVASPSGSSSSGGGTLSKLGIQPLNWLSSPTIVGSDTVGGTSTTHIRAGVNVTALVSGLSRFLQKASTLGVSGTTKYSSGLPAATQSRIAGAIQRPSFDLWTGNDDKTMRRLQLGLTVPVTGSISSALGGLSSATLGLRIQYTNLNQPQSIAAPTRVQPYSQFQAKLQAFEQALTGATGATGATSSSGGATGSTGGAATGSSTATTPSPSPSSASSSSSSAAVSAYSRCLAAAGTDVAKMQQCAPLLNSK
jgi:hypothetical protein